MPIALQYALFQDCQQSSDTMYIEWHQSNLLLRHLIVVVANEGSKSLDFATFDEVNFFIKLHFMLSLGLASRCAVNFFEPGKKSLQ